MSYQVYEFVESLKIKLLSSSPYYAQANGQVKSSNKTLIKLMKKKKIKENPKRWHEVLSAMLWARRISKQSVTKVTCFELVYGQVVLPAWSTWCFTQAHARGSAETGWALGQVEPEWSQAILTRGWAMWCSRGTLLIWAGPSNQFPIFQVFCISFSIAPSLKVQNIVYLISKNLQIWQVDR
jgi:hypothetical protein